MSGGENEDVVSGGENEDVVSGGENATENGHVGVEAKEVNPQTDAVLRELATDGKAVI